MNKFKIDHFKIDHFVYILLLASVLRKVEPAAVNTTTSSVNETDIKTETLTTEKPKPVSTETMNTTSPPMDVISTNASEEVTVTDLAVHNTTLNGVTNSTPTTNHGNDSTTEDSNVTIKIIAVFVLTVILLLLLIIILYQIKSRNELRQR